MACQTVFHHSCAKSSQECPKCHRNVQQLEETQDETAAERSQANREHGKVLVIGAAGLLGVLELAIILAFINLDKTNAATTASIRALLEAVLLWQAINGSRGAQRAFSVLAGAGAILMGIGLLNQAPTGFLLAFVGITMLFNSWVFGFSKTAREYMSDRAARLRREPSR